MSRAFAALFVVLSASSATRADDEAAREKDLKAIVGTWKVVRFEMAGKVAPEGEAKASVVIEEGGKGVLKPEGGEARFSFTLDPSRKPKQITIIYAEGPLKGKIQYGIYELDDKTLTFCFADPKAGEDERPRSFKTEDTDHLLVVHERVREGK